VPHKKMHESYERERVSFLRLEHNSHGLKNQHLGCVAR